MRDFVHLHLHTEYSLLDGACRIDQLMGHVKSLGQTAVAITDHGVMYGVIDFYKAAQKHGIKPIIGCEVYVAPRSRFDKVHKLDNSPYHLVLLCENNTGYQNLIYLVSKGFIEGFYGKPRIDRELLQGHTEGLIALSACLAGELPRKLTAGDYEAAKEAALFYRDLFGPDNYFIELQDHGIPEQQRILPDLVRLAEEVGVGLVATNDAHYLQREDSRIQHVLICIQTNHMVDDESDLEFPTQEFYVKSGDEMARLFDHYPGAIENTVRIARRCEVTFEFGKVKLPHFSSPDGTANDRYFRKLCYDGLRQKYGENPDQAVADRLAYELGVIENMGYVDYFLIVHDFIAYAKGQGIPVGPGRGSGAGSLAAYCTGITGIDPIKYGLLFERFLNPERVSMPDFDIDFCYERRQEVIDYVVRKYGSDHVAQIITFGTMAARGSIRDVGRALGMSYQTTDQLAKMIPMELGMTIEKALKSSAELRQFCEQDDKVQNLIDMARQVEGMPRHASTHAAGVVITHSPADRYVPLQKNDESIVTQFPMNTLEELGLLKMDFLGLRTLTVIDHVQNMIRQRQPDFDIDAISLEDKDVFEMLSQGNTAGVFQFESAGMRQVLVQLGPVSLEDLIAVISLYRPGPMESIPKYIANRHNPQGVTYRHPLLQPILEVTNGCIVYQEQVMQICRQMAGYSYAQADLVRRAMSKKKHDIMEKERARFMDGAKANNVPASVANAIFDEMTSFASYAFNKSHAAAYALLAYQTAYLKRHYTKEFMAALLTSVLDNTDKMIDYIDVCTRDGIKVLPPHVNQSSEGFTVVEKGIRFGLLGIKNIGRGFIRDLLEERKTKYFSSFSDFCQRLYGKDLNKRTLESLIKCGALDHMGANRHQMLMGFPAILEDIAQLQKSNITGQTTLFDTPGTTVSQGYTLPDIAEYPLSELLSMEKEATGLYISGHPMVEYEEVYTKIGAKKLKALQEADEGAGIRDGIRIKVAGIVTHKRIKATRSNETMAFVTMEDMTGSMDVLVFPKILEENGNLLTVGKAVVMGGRLSLREDEDAKIVCESVEPIEMALTAGQVDNTPKSSNGNGNSNGNIRPGLYIKVEREDSESFRRAVNLIQIFDGAVPLYVKFANSGKTMLAPKNLWVDANDLLVKELQSILEAANVAWIQ